MGTQEQPARLDALADGLSYEFATQEEWHGPCAGCPLPSGIIPFLRGGETACRAAVKASFTEAVAGRDRIATYKEPREFCPHFQSIPSGEVFIKDC